MNSIMDMLKKPAVAAAVALVIGLLLGLTYAWVLDPLEVIDQPMTYTRLDLQEEYLRMSIDSFRVNADELLAKKRFEDIGANAPALLQAIKAAPGKLDPNAILVFEQVLNKNGVVTLNQGQPAPGEAAGNSAVTTAIIVGGLLTIAGVAAAAFWLLRGGRRSGPLTPAQQAVEASRAVERTDYSATGQEPPVAQYVTTYVLGDDLFDDSFSIDSPSGEFLGECGVGISETIGVGDPKKVTAFEVWMFDKNDIQTVTKVMMSTHAFADAGFRGKLEAKGELVDIVPHRQVVLETQTLQMVATVADMQYGQGALPDGSYFDRLTLELAIWAKK